MFSHTPQQLQELVSYLLSEAKALGATNAAAELSEGNGLSVSVRKGDIETIEQNLDKQAGVTVFIGQRRGNAGTSDFSKESLKASVQAAFHIAQHTAEDDCAGLAEAHLFEKIQKILICSIHGTLQQLMRLRLPEMLNKGLLQSARISPIVMVPPCLLSNRILCWELVMVLWEAMLFQGITFHVRQLLVPLIKRRCYAA